MNSTRIVSMALAGLLAVPASVFGWEAALNRVAQVTGETSAVVESDVHPGYAANADKALEADSAPAVLREAKSYADGKVEPKRDKDDCSVYRKVKDCWLWTNWAGSGESHEAPADFLVRANSPSALQLYHEGPDAAGSWFGANQYWPDGKLKYDQGYGPSGAEGVLSTVLNFRFTARDKDGSTELYRFGATATRVDPTNETLVSWSDSTTNQFIRMATTDIVEAMAQEKGEEIVDFGTNYINAAIAAIKTSGGQARPLPKYLHELAFDSSYPEAAERYYAEVDGPFGNCSARRVGNLCERNLDWYDDEAPEFVVRVSKDGTNRFASVGVANVGTNLTEDFVTTGRWSWYYKALPGHTTDGINENGVFCEVNVVPTNGSPWEVDRTGRDINSLGGVRWVLDHATDAASAATNLANRVYIASSMLKAGYSVHFAICDKTGTYVVEDGEVDYWTPNVPAVMTNFRVFQYHQPDLYGSGYERFSLLAGGAPITNVWYSKAYETNSLGLYPWPSEFAGMKDADGFIPYTDEDRLQTWAQTWVTPNLPERRNVGYWHTVHTAVYDLDRLSFRIAVQEIDDWYEFSLKPNGLAYGEMTAYVDAAEDRIKSLPCTKELILTPEQIAQGVTFESHGANQNSAVEIGRGAKAAMDQEYVSSVHTEKALRSVAVAIGAYATATNSDRTASSQAIAIGFTACADGSQAIAIGAGAKHLDDETDLTGDNTYAHGSQSLAIGYSAKAIGSSTVAIGSSTAASKGKCTTATAKSATAIGFDARATGEGAMAIGYDVEASGKKSFALGETASAQGASSVQIGPGTNKLDHTLQFEDVLIVKDGRVIGSQPDPKIVDPTQGQQSEELEITVTPGSYTTLLPTNSAPFAPGMEVGVSCTGLRNYTVFVPNEDSVRPGLPASFQFELPAGLKHASVGDTSFTRLPVRITLEQPYEGFVSARCEYFDDGTDWTPVVTNCTVYFDLDTGSFKSETNSIEGFSLHAAKVFKISYTGGDGATKVVTLMEAGADKAFLPSTYYHYVGSVDQKVSQGDAPPFSSPLHATFTYETVNGSVTFTKDIEVK